MSQYFTLHIGVNEYHEDSEVPNLNGCAHDVDNLKSFLEKIIPQEKLHSKVLLDADATYQNVVTHFGDKHLLKAKKNDVVLIQYSGHGAREKAAPEFDPYFPDGYNETMVLHDSRIEGGLDLADKELSVLIERIALKGAHVVLIVDSCHSGSISRDIDPSSDEIAEDETVTKRQFLAKEESRPYEKYLNGHFSKNYPEGKGMHLPSSKHIVLAACRKTETALEIGGKGFFTTNLVKVLEKESGNISYSNLFSKCIVKMAQRSQHQHPQFDTSGFFNAHDGFLKRGTNIKDSSWKLSLLKNRWKMNCGAIHGLPIAMDKHSVFEISLNGKEVGHATSFRVNIDSCFVNLDFEPENSEVYDAKLISLPDAPILIRLEGNKKGKDRVVAAIEKNKNKKENHQFLNFQFEEDILSKYKIEVTEDKLEIFRTKDNFRIRTVHGDDDKKVFDDVFEVLNHISQWEKLLQLDNEGTTLKKDNVQMVLRLVDDQGELLHEVLGNEIKLNLFKKGNVNTSVNFQVDVLNRDTTNELFVTLFYFSEEFEIYTFYDDVIPPNSKARAIDRDEDGDFNYFYLDDNDLSIDNLKLFVSTQQISTYLLEKEKSFELGDEVSFFTKKSVMRNAVTERKIGGKRKDKKIFIEDWYTKTMTIYSVASEKNELSFESDLSKDEMKELMKFKMKRSPNSSASSSSATDIRSAPSSNVIKVLPHSSFQGDVNVAPLVKQKSIIGDDGLIDILQKPENRRSGLLSLNDATRGSGDERPILEISNIKNEASLKENPLQIELNTNQHNEAFIAFAYDGKDLIPVGQPSKTEDGNVIINIDKLPKEEPSDIRKKNIGRALKFVFFKLVLKQDDVYQLRWVDYADGMCKRRSRGLINKVAEAKNILICIHGIIGDTNVMADKMRSAFWSNTYNLVLTFDYENLNTPIEQTAGQLKTALEDVGITAESGQNITILSHSMGGLVSRYFIELQGGNQIVRKLVMAGTPNAGSNISNVTDYRNLATTLLTLAANTGIGIPAAASILAVLSYSKKLTLTLEQMHVEKSNFLKTLNESPDPGVPYYIICGNFQQYLDEKPHDEKLVTKALNFVSDLFYNEANDIAVSVHSIGSVEASRVPAPEVVKIAGHHLNYFVHQPSLDQIKKWLMPESE